MELDLDQFCPYAPASKKPKSKVGASSATVEGSKAHSPKKSTSSGVPKKKKPTSSSKRPAPSKPAATLDPFWTKDVEAESSLEPLKRKKMKKMKIKDSEPAPSKMAPSNPPPSGSEGVLTS